MKLMFDQNLSPKLAKYFEIFFEGSIHVQELGLEGSNDLLIWEYAKSHGFTIVTKDSDFNNFATYFGFPPKVIWLKKGNCSTTILKALMVKNIDFIKSFIIDPNNGILIIK